MRGGLLWFDDDPARTLEDKVLRAATHYEHKLGHRPTLCLVHPGCFDGNGKQSAKVDDVEVRPGRSVLRHHFWLGVGEDGGGNGGGPPGPRHSLVSRVEASRLEPMTPEKARQLALQWEGGGDGQHTA